MVTRRIKRSAGQGAGQEKERIDWPQRRDSIDEIARRLDELLRDMADVPAAHEGGGLTDGVLEAARQAWEARRERERIFGSSLGPDPAWDLLLELFIAKGEGREATAATVSAASGLPEATVLRCIAHLADARLVGRQPHPFDTETVYLTLTDRAVAMISDFLARTMPASGAAAA